MNLRTYDAERKILRLEKDLKDFEASVVAVTQLLTEARKVKHDLVNHDELVEARKAALTAGIVYSNLCKRVKDLESKVRPMI